MRDRIRYRVGAAAIAVTVACAAAGSGAVAGVMLVRAYKLFAGYRWGGPLFFYQARDLGSRTDTYQNFFGLLSFNFRPKPAYAAYLSANTAVRRALRR